MSFLTDVFNTFLYKPLFNALIFLYQFLPGMDFGIAVIVLIIIIRIILYPLMVKSIKSQKMMSELQPKMQEIQQKYKDDKEVQTREMMKFYKEKKINPFGGCLPLLIQLPIMIALYRVFLRGFDLDGGKYLYSFIPNPGEINPFFLGIINLSEPILILAIIAGIVQFFQTKMLMVKNTKLIKEKEGQMPNFSNIMQKQMLYFFPAFTVIILLKLPSAIALYWIVTAGFSIFQQKLILNK